ncbi:MAG: hypothetical protein INQ03_04255 [Candidatus Heimdallarchaeota archaeon]|nr:hypothetical protein [Candidatus Heimdallarchaeota archaeon]
MEYYLQWMARGVAINQELPMQRFAQMNNAIHTFFDASYYDEVFYPGAYADILSQSHDDVPSYAELMQGEIGERDRYAGYLTQSPVSVNEFSVPADLHALYGKTNAYVTSLASMMEQAEKEMNLLYQALFEQDKWWYRDEYKIAGVYVNNARNYYFSQSSHIMIDLYLLRSGFIA